MSLTVSAAFILILTSLARVGFSQSRDDCKGYPCAVDLFPSIFLGPSNRIERRKIKFFVFTTWLGESKYYNHSLTGKKLNHLQYCEENGYMYQHFSISHNEMIRKWKGYPSSYDKYWYKVYVTRDLLNSGLADYYVYLDTDVIFARLDFRLEQLIDPFERYSLYIPGSKEAFTQTQSFIFKGNSTFSNKFVDEWLEYHHYGSCKDISGEQGAFMMAMTTFFNNQPHESRLELPEFICARECFVHPKGHPKAAMWHYFCLTEWLKAYTKLFDGKCLHSDIFVYQSHVTLTNNIGTHSTLNSNSKIGGYIDNFPDYDRNVKYNFFTIHPCKSVPFSPPDDALYECITENRKNIKQEV